MFQRFFHSEVAGSVVLLVAAVVALVWANSPFSDGYFDLAYTKIGVSWGDATFELSLQHWINDGLMVLFFFVVGLEIKREIVVGQLSTAREAFLPVMAAIGGMAIPAGVYLLVIGGGEAARGWGVPMATDIAFALGILALFGSRVPLALKVFLTALAIVDDLGAVMVIALFYTETIRVVALVIAGIFLLLLIAANRAHMRSPGVFIVLGLGVWGGVLASGVHATIAGVLVALAVPVRPRISPNEFMERAREAVGRLRELGEKFTRGNVVRARDQYALLDDLHDATRTMRPSGLVLEEALHPVQAYFILPLFALFNAGVRLDAEALGGADDPITLAIVLGLVVGKQIGVTGFAWLAVRTGRATLPDGVTWAMIYGTSLLAGVGFTMSLFISELAFDGAIVGMAKLGILIGSLVAGVWGYLVLAWALRRAPAT